MNLAQLSRDINDSASLSIVVDNYFQSEAIDMDVILVALNNILQKCADGHHQSREMAMVGMKIIKLTEE